MLKSTGVKMIKVKERKIVKSKVVALQPWTINF